MPWEWVKLPHESSDILTNHDHHPLTFVIFSGPKLQFSSVQLLSRVRLFATPWIAARQASLSITNSGVHANSCPSSRWCHPAISSSVILLSSCLLSFPASGSFSMSWLFVSGGQSIGASVSAPVLPMSIHSNELISLGSTGLYFIYLS